MLGAIGVRTIEDLFDEIPAKLRVDGLPGVPAGLSEAAVTRLMRERAARNVPSLCFLGAYIGRDHIRAGVCEIVNIWEFYSA